MEIRLRFLFLTLFAVFTFSLSVAVSAAEKGDDKAKAEPVPGGTEIIQQDPVIQPEIKRRKIKESSIDTENFEIGIFLGFLSIEDFGTEPVYAARASYHITEDIFIEGTIGFSRAGTTSFERLSGGINLVADEDRDYEFYEFALGYNLFPGETFIGRNKALNSAVYLVGGIGNTEFAGDDRFTIVIGGGFRLTITDWFAVHATVRDHIFNIDVTGEEKDAHNIEISIGTTFFF